MQNLSDNAVEALLEPLDGLLALDLVVGADTALGAVTSSDALTLAGHADVEVHAVDTDGGVVLNTKVDVLADTEAEVASLGEVALAELVLLDLEATLENLLGLFRRVSVLRARAQILASRDALTFGPRTVTWTEIFSLRRIPKVRTV